MARNKHEWHKWFAWRPIIIRNPLGIKIIWLKYCWRKVGNPNEYRVIGDDPFW